MDIVKQYIRELFDSLNRLEIPLQPPFEPKLSGDKSESLHNPALPAFRHIDPGAAGGQPDLEKIVSPTLSAIVALSGRIYMELEPGADCTDFAAYEQWQPRWENACCKRRADSATLNSLRWHGLLLHSVSATKRRLRWVSRWTIWFFFDCPVSPCERLRIRRGCRGAG